MVRDLSRLPCGIFDSVEGAEIALKERGSIGEVREIPLNQLSMFPYVWESEESKQRVDRKIEDDKKRILIDQDKSR